MKRLPLIIFLGSVFILISAFASRVWISYTSDELETKIETFERAENNHISAIASLSAQLEQDEVVTDFKEFKTKGIPKCSFSGLRLVCKDTWIKTKIPTTRVVGKVQDPVVLKQIEQHEVQMKELRTQLELATQEARRVSKFEELTSINFQQFISLIFMVAAFYILLSKKYNEESLKWAMGTLGTVLGYWFGG